MSPDRKGALFAVTAAALFGMSAPLAKLLLPSAAPLPLAGLLYLGGGMALLLTGPRRRSAEAPPRGSDALLLAGVILCGGIAGPFLMLLGLQRLSAVTGSLLLTLEGPLTAALALLLFREHLTRRALAASALIFLGGALLAYRPVGLRADLRGVLCLLGACLAWALDNNLTQRLSLKDPTRIVRIKALGAGSCVLLLSLATRQPLPGWQTVGLALGLGGFSYGLSIVLDVHALRLLGAAREAAFFATAPFLGALTATVVLHERPTGSDLAAGAVMVAGVALLLRDRHSHLHTHEVLEHEHLHVHDEHHSHPHEGPVTEPHSHPHRHEPLTHEHRHVSDLHHRHKHS